MLKYFSMKVYISKAFILFTLMLFLCAEARGDEFCTVSTFLAVNTSRGAQLVYKNSDTNNINNITFEGLYLSSVMACGMNYRRCPSLTVIMDGNLLLVVMPMQEHFGLVTYDKYGNNFSFREKYAINISKLDIKCEISSISQYFSSELTVIGRCLHTTSYNMLDSVYVAINSSSLSESDYFLGLGCTVDAPSEFIFLVSATFPMGVTIFVDNGQVRFQRNGEGCELFREISGCSDIQRFTSVPPDQQAIYCESTTYLIDLVEHPAIQTFLRDNYGLPFFCPKLTFYAYKDGSISFHYTTNGTQIGSTVPVGFLLNNDDVVWGDCVNGTFVVMQSAGGKVISLTVNTNKVDSVGHSETIPRIFGMSVLLNNFTHALVYDLQTGKLVEVIKQDFLMGYVVSNCDLRTTPPRTTPPRTTPVQTEPRKLSPSTLAAIVISPFVVILLVSFGIGCCICCKKNDSRGRRKRSMLNERPLEPIRSEDEILSSENSILKSNSESSNLDIKNADESDRHIDDLSIYMYVDGSGQSQSVTVNSPNLDLASSNMNHEISVNGYDQPQRVSVDNSELDPAHSNMIHQESADGSGQLVAGDRIWHSLQDAIPAANNLAPSTPNPQQQLLNFQVTQGIQASLHYGENLEVNTLAQVDANGSARSDEQLGLEII